MISCCGKYKECSKERFCLNSRYKNECSYAQKLIDGHNFYDNEHMNRLYILVGGRCYAVSRRSSNNTLYQPDEASSETLKNELDRLGIAYLEQYEFKHCFVERTSDINPAYWDIAVMVGDNHYTIRNFNIRLMTKNLATDLRAYLFDKGLACSVTTSADKKTLFAIRNAKSGSEVKKIMKPKEIVVEVAAKVKSGAEIARLGVVDNQMDMFGLLS